MKIVFIQPKSFHTWEALNLGYIASYAKAKGFNKFKFFSGFYRNWGQIFLFDKAQSAGRLFGLFGFSGFYSFFGLFRRAQSAK